MVDRRRIVAPVTAALLLLVAAPAHAKRIKDIEHTTARQREGNDYLRHGKPLAALQLFGLKAAALNNPSKPPKLDLAKATSAERALCAYALLRIGHHKLARKAVKGCEKVPCVLAAAAIEAQSGSRKARLKLLAAAFKKHKSPTLQVEMGHALHEVGQRFAGRRLLDPLADAYQDGQLKAIEELVAVARSLALNGYFKDANEVLAEAAEGATTEPERLLVELHWGLLFLSKYNYRDADVSLSRVLKIDPFHPEATVAMARIDLGSDNDVRKARARLDALLKRQPNNPSALAMRAEVAIRDEELPAARGFVDKALKLRPDHPEALHALAAVALRMDDGKTFQKTEKTALKHDPGDGELYLKAAHYLELGHRYPEVLKLLQTALKKNPELWQAHAQLGMSYARVADDKNAAKHLALAFDNDPFNVRTANILNVLYDGVLKQMHILKGEHVDLRVHRRNRKALERTMLPFLQDSYELLAKKYGMAAKKPLQVEIFPTTEQFSVRTVGLPRLGAHAVCFGHLITSRSPHERPFNWKMVLHHEMSHVFHIQASGGRVPRWLTEGVAMMESAWMDPTWHIVAERRAYDRLKAGGLAKIATFNLAFSQARSMQGIVDAYYQAMLLVRFLNEKWGFSRINQLIKAHGKGGQDTTKLVKKIYGKSTEQLDEAFAAWLDDQLDRYDRDFRPAPEVLKVRLAKEWKGDGRHREGLRKALLLMDKADLGGARQTLQRAVMGRQDGKGKLVVPPLDKRYVDPVLLTTEEGCAAAYLLMDLALAHRDRREAVYLAQQLSKGRDGLCDGVVQRLIQAKVAHKEGRHDEAKQHFEKAHERDPRDGSVLAMWLRATRKKERALRIELARKMIALMPNDTLGPLMLATQSWRDLAADLGLPAPAAIGDKVDGPKTAGGPANPLKTALRAVGQKVQQANAAASPLPKKKLDAATKKQRIGDLKLAARRLEEVVPTRRASVLYEARLAVAQGRLKWALPIYRDAAGRAASEAQRAEVWCELAVVAERAAAKDDAAEAKRRCAAARAQ